MGARTINRKREDERLSLNRAYPSLNSPESHLPKKPKITWVQVQQSPDRRIIASNSAVARLSRYPTEISQLRREVHAPCRTLKFGIFKSSNWNSRTKSGGILEKNEEADNMGNILSLKYNEAKRQAFDSLRYSQKDKEAIELDTETEINVIVSENSSIEEVNAMKIEELKDQFDVMDWSSREVDGVVVNTPELDAKPIDLQNQPCSSSMVTESRIWSEKLEDAEKMLDDLSLTDDISSVSVYKKLLEQVERRTSKLMNLDFEIQLNEKRRAALHIERQEKEEVKEVSQELFVELTREEEDEIGRSFSGNSRRRVLITHENSNIEITGEILQCLGPGAWLNDEVINLYFELLKERENREPKKFLKCHFFNTFFYKKLISGRNGYDYKSVRRWTTKRKLGYELIDCDKIFVPIHKEIHWCLAVINKKDKKFQYLDSLRGMDSHVLKILARYLVDEAKDKSEKVINVNSWEQEFVKDLPEQENGFDCGMFMIKYADFYSRGLGLCFNQQHMSYFRRRTAKEILRLRAD